MGDGTIDAGLSAAGVADAGDAEAGEAVGLAGEADGKPGCAGDSGPLLVGGLGCSPAPHVEASGICVRLPYAMARPVSNGCPQEGGGFLLQLSHWSSRTITSRFHCGLVCTDIRHQLPSLAASMASITPGERSSNSKLLL